MGSNIFSLGIFMPRGAARSFSGDNSRVGTLAAQSVNSVNKLRDFQSYLAENLHAGELEDFMKNFGNKMSEIDKKITQLDELVPNANIGSKALNVASKIVDPLIVASAGYRVLTADDKEYAAYTEGGSLAGMFATEKLLSSKVVSKTVAETSEKVVKTGVEFLTKNVDSLKCLEKNSNAAVKIGAFVLSGVVFAAASIFGSNLGGKAGKAIIDKKRGVTTPPVEETSTTTEPQNVAKENLSIES